MYVQITNRCNLSCKHCLFSCTTQGYDMDFVTFINVCKYYKRLNIKSGFCIGGGEPTLHENIIEFIYICKDFGIRPTISINGTIEDKALEIADLADLGIVMAAQLSNTIYHKNQTYKISKAVAYRYKGSDSVTNENRFGPITATDLDVVLKIGRAHTLSEAKDITKLEKSISGFFVTPFGDLRENMLPTSKILYNINECIVIQKDAIYG